MTDNLLAPEDEVLTCRRCFRPILDGRWVITPKAQIVHRGNCSPEPAYPRERMVAAE